MKKIKNVGKSFRLMVAQLKPVMGDIPGNLALAREVRARAAVDKADLILFTELFICGYSPEDLVLKPAFLKACEQAMYMLALDTQDGGPGIIIGTPLQRQDNLYNAVVVLDKGKLIAERYKIDLANYDQFDEKRVFTSGIKIEPVTFRDVSIGLPICEDVWNDSKFCKKLAKKGAQLILVLNGSPFSRKKFSMRLEVIARQVKESSLPIVYANQFGGQDEVVYDGGSFALQADGSLAFQMKHFQEDVVTTIWKGTPSSLRCIAGPRGRILSNYEADYAACMIGLADYVNNNGFKNVVLGLSGGIDSALCAAIAVDALGANRVYTIMLPYCYTSQDSLDDAQACAKLLGCHYNIVPINAAVEGFLQVFTLLFSEKVKDVTKENLQSRVRGTILMAISNKFGSMLISTGNKSEISVGYTTLYGDMNGGFNPIKDVYKTQVNALSKWRNAHKPINAKGPAGAVIPENILNKAPSAELSERQKDQDSLPPYDVLDSILECMIENEMGADSIIARGYDKVVVERVEKLLCMAEYKRRQAAPGIKITDKNFGRDRRYPITNHFRSFHVL
ncbi:MAG: NAD+ synthase [Candidatus Tokpelaia sp. JSC188]|nr:MAG: NAD+ synthase [Candidatus Tokpelaia sp. JSC188]